MTSVLVTGGAGYVGSHTVSELLTRGFAPVVVDNLHNGFREALQPDIPFYQADVRDTEALRGIFAKHNFSAVIHLAALAIVAESFEKADEYFDVNYYGTLSVLDCCREFGVRRLVFSSSSTIYGDASGQEKLTEKHPLAPINPYGKSKQLCEEALAASNLEYIVLRYFNVAGACSQGRNGPRGQGSGRVLFNAGQAALSGEKLTLNGRDYDTADGTCVRDYIHVEDIADIQIRALQYLEKPELHREIAGEPVRLTLNCGYGRGYSVQEIVESYKRHNAVDFPVEWGPRRDGDPAHLVGDTARLEETLHWRSRFADPLAAICRTAHAWALKQGLIKNGDS